MSSSDRPATLTLPYAVLGLVGGAIVGHVMTRGGPDAAWIPLVIGLTTTLVAARLGRRITRSLGETPLGGGWWLPVLGRGLLAGGLNGVVLMFLVMLGNKIPNGGGEALGFLIFPGSLLAWLFGVVVSLPFIPSLVVMAGAYRRALAARPGSIAAEALERRLWLATSGTAVVHLGLALLLNGEDHWHRSQPALALLKLLLVLASAGTVVTLSAEVKGFVRLRGAMRWAERLTRRDPVNPSGEAEVAPHPDLIDLGTGDAQFLAVDVADNPYRAVDQKRLALVGDPQATRLALREATAWLVGGLALVVAPPATLVLYVMCR